MGDRATDSLEFLHLIVRLASLIAPCVFLLVACVGFVACLMSSAFLIMAILIR